MAAICHTLSQMRDKPRSSNAKAALHNLALASTTTKLRLFILFLSWVRKLKPSMLMCYHKRQ